MVGVVWKRPALLRRSIHRHASESTSKFGGAAGNDNGTPRYAAHHLTTLNSCYVCHLPATRRPRHGSPGAFKKPRGDSFRVRERHPARLEFQYMPGMIPIRESLDTVRATLYHSRNLAINFNRAPACSPLTRLRPRKDQKSSLLFTVYLYSLNIAAGERWKTHRY